MATVNYTSSTNNANIVLWGWSTALEYRTDRAAGSFDRHALVDSVQNLGVGVTRTNPFTNLS